MTEYNFDRLQGETKFRHLVRLSVDKLNGLHKTDWLDIKEMFDFQHSGESLRKYAAGWKLLLENEEIEQLNSEEEITYKETTEILSDGSHKSDKLIRMNAEQSKDINYILEAHGFNKESWELVNAKNNIWNVYSKQDGVQSLYSSKITVKPKVSGFDVDKFLEKAKQEIIPVHIIEKVTEGIGLLEVPLFDLHFGVNTYESYIPVRDKTLSKIHSKKWDKIFFIIGQDLLHNNGFDGKTSSGTLIEKVDMDKAWDDAFTFYCDLINAAQNNSNSVECSYSIANHDDSMSWSLVKCLEIKFPDIKFDTSKKVRKSFVWNDVFIGYSHGHKGSSRLHENFLSDFGKQMAVAEVVEIHTGHIHTETAKDKFGVLVRTLSTKGKTDDWHDDNGFVGAHKRFQLFEYSPSSLDAIYYI
ncbi:hypothetical protein [Bacillus sp. T33-2]|uniref:hypothetical protein n=1 Tax=Bacillus sp. T33-2 TaxID=2054168 RepID=UPI000C7816B8|nr:hypothetical protein [Bacillus sp. T33-2]PLR99634.1 hypothetical protein CVD19_00810 [Bacillus sp. T33-2]